MSHLIPTTFVIFFMVCFMCFEPCIHARNLNSHSIEKANPLTTTMKVEEVSIKENGYTPASKIYGSYATGPDESGRGHETPPTPTPVTPPHH